MQKMLFNPLLESGNSNTQAEACIVVIFGATGDLTARKLMPALYNLAKEEQLPAHFACVAFARRDKETAAFRHEMKEAVSEFSRTKPLDEKLWERFAERLFYHNSSFDSGEGYEALKHFLIKLDNEFGTKGNRLFYLSTQPSYFPVIVSKLKAHGLIATHTDRGPFSRVIVEKPFGHDLETATTLSSEMLRHLHEKQIYRIDHYLGKETVQNLMVFRFANSIFESVWNNHHIDHVQITVAESIGIGGRGPYFEEAGIVRDMVQNHIMQLVSLVAMEPPGQLKAEAIRNEKVKVLQSIRPFDLKNIDKSIVRGQYISGLCEGTESRSYREEERVNPNSFVETFVAMRLDIDNWRWAGVPFFLRTGKRLPKRVSEIAIVFKEAPQHIFGNTGSLRANTLAIRIQPNEGISFMVNCKIPGPRNLIQPVKMDFRYDSYFGMSAPEAYERLIYDSILGDGTLFTRGDEVLESWNLLTPVLEHFAALAPSNDDFFYPAGSWGPPAADALLAPINATWRMP